MQLPCCRHSRAFDCVTDSSNALLENGSLFEENKPASKKKAAAEKARKPSVGTCAGNLKEKGGAGARKAADGGASSPRAECGHGPQGQGGCSQTKPNAAKRKHKPVLTKSNPEPGPGSLKTNSAPQKRQKPAQQAVRSSQAAVGRTSKEPLRNEAGDGQCYCHADRDRTGLCRTQRNTASSRCTLSCLSRWMLPPPAAR